MRRRRRCRRLFDDCRWSDGRTDACQSPQLEDYSSRLHGVAACTAWLRLMLRERANRIIGVIVQFRPHRRHRTDAAYCCRRRAFRGPCVCLSVRHTGEPCNDTRTSRDSRGHREQRFRWKCTLKPPGEYDWSIRSRRPYVVIASYFDHLFSSGVNPASLFFLCTLPSPSHALSVPRNSSEIHLQRLEDWKKIPQRVWAGQNTLCVFTSYHFIFLLKCYSTSATWFIHFYRVQNWHTLKLFTPFKLFIPPSCPNNKNWGWKFYC